MPAVAARSKPSRRAPGVVATSVVVLGAPTLLTGALAALLARRPEFRVAAEAETPEAADAALAGARLVLVNACEFGPSERRAIARLKAAHPRLPIVAVVPEIPMEGAPGVDAFVPASSSSDQLLSVLGALAA